MYSSCHSESFESEIEFERFSLWRSGWPLGIFFGVLVLSGVELTDPPDGGPARIA